MAHTLPRIVFSRRGLASPESRPPEPEILRQVLVEGKEVTSLHDLDCLEAPATPEDVQMVAGNRQLGRVKHNILAVGPTLLIPAASNRAEHWLKWWVASWEPSYREVDITDLRSVQDLADIAYDSGLQLGSGELSDSSVRKQALSAVVNLDARLRKETSTIVNELLAGWQEFRERQRSNATR